MKKIGIYKITSPSNKTYIGQSVDIEKRFKTYKRLNCKSQKKLYASFLKYGVENHKFEIIEECEIVVLDKLEKYYVDFYNTFNTKLGLNIRDGGGNSAKLSEEQKQKISNSLKGKNHSKERIEANRKGQLGKKLSEEHKEKIRLNNTKPNLGKKASLETRLKQSLSHLCKQQRLGCKLTEAQKKHLSEINKGSKNPNFGKKRSEESKLKTSEKLKQYWLNKKLCQK